MHGPADLSSFYLGNEEISREILRLVDSGALSPLLALLTATDTNLRIEAVREQQGLSELLGFLGATSEAATRDRRLPLYQEDSADPLLEASSVWDPAATLCTRSRFKIVKRDGTLEEVYMPDHVCPECLNDRGNLIDECHRVCVRCEFRW